MTNVWNMNLGMVSNAIRNIITYEYAITNICEVCGEEYGFIKEYNLTHICPDCEKQQWEDWNKENQSMFDVLFEERNEIQEMEYLAHITGLS